MLVPVWTLCDDNGNNITTDREEQKNSLLANGWELLCCGLKPDHSVLDEIVDNPDWSKKH